MSAYRDHCVEETRRTLRSLFFRSGIMRSFRKGHGITFRALMDHRVTPPELSAFLYGAAPRPPKFDEAEFTFRPIYIADELWAAVTGKLEDRPELLIIPPFPIPEQDKRLVALFPEEQ